LKSIERRALLALCCALLIAPQLSYAKKKKKEEETQTLQVPRDPPTAVVAETKKLAFHVTPLSAKGLLSQQVRDALKVLFRLAGSNSIVDLRAFVAGSGDVRRVRDIVSETFTDRRQNLPALSVIQVGALPLEGAQVVLESVEVRKKEVNDYGLAFLSGQSATSANPLDPVLPLAEKSLASLRAALKSAGSETDDVLRVTCYLSSLDNSQAVRQLFVSAFPHAAFDYLQAQRAPVRAIAECEAVAKLRWNTGTDLHFVDQAALVAAPKVVITGAQTSFGYQDSDARLAFQRLGKALEPFHTGLRRTAMAHYYPLSLSLAEQVRRIRSEFLDAAHPPASTMLNFEGLPSMEAGFAADVVAIAGNEK
jgi:enamine deaminase RidA (YjgF/YER057c/UK114 family)